MRKFYCFFTIAFIALVFTGCKKDLITVQENTLPGNASTQDRIEVIRKTVEANFTKALTIDKGQLTLTWDPSWKETTTFKGNDTVDYVYIPLSLKIYDAKNRREVKNVSSSTSKRYLVVIFNKSTIRYQVATYILAANSHDSGGAVMPLKSITSGAFSGYIVYTDLNTNVSGHQLYQNGKPTYEFDRKIINSNPRPNIYVCRDFYTCFYVSYDEFPGCDPTFAILGGYDQCSEPDPSSGGCYYLFELINSNIERTCYDTEDPNGPPPPPGTGGGTGDGGSGDGSSPGNAVPSDDILNATFVNDDKPAIDVRKFINCFTDGKTASSYKLTLYVDQPIHGTNDQYHVVVSPTFVGGIGLLVPGGTLDVGHTFMQFEKINTDGTSVRQVMGFYPGGNSIDSKGVIKDDSGHPFDESFTQQVSEEQFNNALQLVIRDADESQYVLSRYQPQDEYNCTDAGLTWLSPSGVYIQSPSKGAFANTPGNLGYYLINGSGRTIVNVPNGSAPLGHGPCN